MSFTCNRRQSSSKARSGGARWIGLALASLLVLTGCAQDDADSEASTSPEAEQTGVAVGTQTDSEETAQGDSAIDFVAAIGDPSSDICAGEEYSFGFDTFSDTDAFAVALWDGIQQTAADLGCVEVERLVNGADAAEAVQNAQVFAQQQKDGVILFNVVQAASTGQAQALESADIPLVSLAVPVDGYPFITNEDEKNGRQTGMALAEAYQNSGRSGPVYALLGRYDDQESTKARIDGVEAALTEAIPDIEILDYQTQVDGPTTQSATAARLQQIPEDATMLLTAANEDLAFASLQAVRQADRLDSTFVVGIGGANPTGLQYVCENESWVGTVGFFPERWADFLIPALIGEINGAEVPSYPDENIVVETELITTDNISEFYPDYDCG